MSNERFLCIHGHFYQPPRENAWLESVELQDSAFPYHDWNERIAAEAYAPNAYARRLDGEGRIEHIVNNYSRISFNFGPTLLAWMKERAADLHEAIVEGDKQSQQRFSGHGSALAQCYNHMIMPLANRRDKYTQVFWGIRDFEQRFGRKPEGMWLPECAADNESLDVLAELGIKFTILSPYQAKRIRPVVGGDWEDVNGGRVDPTRPYVVMLPSKRRLAVFLYDAHISRGIAFEKLLNRGDDLAERLMAGYDASRNWNQLVNIATDGESYGHHHRHGEMALAYALHYIESKNLARLTNYAEYLENNPPAHELEIHQPSAWSCSHGVERWRSDCGCNSGGRPGWNQAWRGPLRETLDWLRDQLAPLYEKHGAEFFRDPWGARDHYIDVILDRAPENIRQFLTHHGTGEFTEEAAIIALRLLEMERHAMLMYTSCGWFFDEISGIETVQVIQYAARAIQLAKDLLGCDLEPGFLERLGRARSNIREFSNGRHVYERLVKPAVMDREKVGAHYAVSSLFESYPKQARIYSYTIDEEDRRLFTAGNARLAIGRVKVTFEITRNSDVISYGVLHMGDHNLNCGVRHFQDTDPYDGMIVEMRETFERADFAGIIRLMDRHFGESNYSLKNLFRDEQRRILDQILASTRDDVFNTYRMVSDRYLPLLRFLADVGAPAPSALRIAIEFVLNSELRRQFDSETMDLERVRTLLQEAERNHVGLEADMLGYAMKAHLDRLCVRLQKESEDLAVVQGFVGVAELLSALPFDINLWKPQNIYYEMASKGVLAGFRDRAEHGDEAAKNWVNDFTRLGQLLGFQVANGAAKT